MSKAQSSLGWGAQGCWNQQQTGADPTQHKPGSQELLLPSPGSDPQQAAHPSTALAPDHWALLHQETHPEPLQLQQNQGHFTEVPPVYSFQQTPALGWVTTGILLFKYLYTCFWLLTLTEIHRLYSQVFSIANYLRLNPYSIFQEGLHKPAALPSPRPFHLKGGKRPNLKLLAFQSAGICSHLSQSPVDWISLHTSVGTLLLIWPCYCWA